MRALDTEIFMMIQTVTGIESTLLLLSLLFSFLLFCCLFSSFCCPSARLLLPSRRFLLSGFWARFARRLLPSLPPSSLFPPPSSPSVLTPSLLRSNPCQGGGLGWKCVVKSNVRIILPPPLGVQSLSFWFILTLPIPQGLTPCFRILLTPRVYPLVQDPSPPHSGLFKTLRAYPPSRSGSF